MNNVDDWKYKLPVLEQQNIAQWTKVVSEWNVLLQKN